MTDLSLNLLDEVSIGLFAGAPCAYEAPVASRLIPYLEWNWLRAAGQALPPVGAQGDLRFIQSALRNKLVQSIGQDASAGVQCVRRNHTDDQNANWLLFLEKLRRGCVGSGLLPDFAGQLAGVVKEMEENIHWHSRRVSSGLVAFLSRENVFEFVVLDRGAGVLRTLRSNVEFENLVDHTEALSVAVDIRNSRFGTHSGRGYGFLDLMTGIANSKALIRLRSGDGMLEMDGTGAERIPFHLAQRASGKGFLIAVSVHP